MLQEPLTPEEHTFAIIEDLTSLNAKTLTRVSKVPNIATAWSWSGKVHAITKQLSTPLTIPS